MVDRERREDKPVYSATWRAQLNEEQLATLHQLERYGWELKFVRKPLFQDPVPVVFDGDRKACCILRSDGTLEDNPRIPLRG